MTCCRVSGPDAVSYLQGQCSQDLAGLAVGRCRRVAAAEPPGEGRRLPPGDPRRRRRVRPRHRPRLRPGGAGPPRAVPAPHQGRHRAPRLGRAWRSADPAPRQARPVGDPTVVVPVAWPGLVGRRPARTGRRRPDGSPGSTTARCCAATRPGRRPGSRPACRSTVGSSSRRTIAAEVGLVERTVSFTKGCFTGQELVARLDARGSKVARRLCGVVVERSDAEAGAPTGRVRRCSPPTEPTRSAHLSSVAWSPGSRRARWPWPRCTAGWPLPSRCVLRWDDASGCDEAAAEAARCRWSPEPDRGRTDRSVPVGDPDADAVAADAGPAATAPPDSPTVRPGWVHRECREEP